MKAIVTGATGFLGRRLVRQLAAEGAEVVCLIRPSSNCDSLREFVGGELWPRVSLETVAISDPEACMPILENADAVYHVAAGLTGSTSALFLNTVVATRNFIKAATQANVRRFVLVSSMGVYGTAQLPNGTTVDESCPVDEQAHRRDPYTFSKVKQEAVAWEAFHEQQLPLVVIRPGVIYGPGRGAMSGRVGLKFGNLLLRMGGRQPMPYVYVDNCATAIMNAGLTPNIEGHAFNVLDDEHPRGIDVLKQYKRAGQRTRSIIIPRWAIVPLCGLYERYSAWSNGQLPAVLTKYKSASMWKPLRYTNQKARNMLGWRPHIGFEEGCRLAIEGTPVK